MKHTEKNQFILFEKEDRINHEDLNCNTSMMETVLERKLEPVLLLDKTEELTDQLYWSIDLPFTPGDWFAFFIELSWPGNGVALNPGSFGSGKAAQLREPKAAVACFPLRNPRALVYFLPLYGGFAESAYLTNTYENMTGLCLRHYTNTANLKNGTYHMRIYGLK